MKIIGNEENLTIYLYNFKISLENKEKLEKYFKKIFKKVKEIYNINLNGFYITTAYVDTNYGIIIEMEREDIDFIYYNDYELEMQLIVKETEFLYKINDITMLKNNFKIYKYQGNYYLKKENKQIIDIIEYVDVIYKETEKILKCGKLKEIP